MPHACWHTHRHTHTHKRHTHTNAHKQKHAHMRRGIWGRRNVRTQYAEAYVCTRTRASDLDLEVADLRVVRVDGHL